MVNPVILRNEVPAVRCRSIAVVLAVLSVVGSLGVAARAQSLPPVPVISTIAGGAANVCAGATDAFGDGCLATQAKLKTAWASLSDAAGNLYIADSGNGIIRRVDAKSGVITLIAGGAATVCASATDTVGDGCLATQAKLNSPRGMVFDRAGNILFVDTSNQRIRKIDAVTGIITSVAGTGVAATTCPSNTAPTVASATGINNAVDIALDSYGNLYIPSSARQCIIVIAANNGVILPDQSLAYTLAGTGTAGSTGDNGPATTALISGPRGILVDPAGNVIFDDFGNNKVRKITNAFPGGTLNLSGATISLVAGTGTLGSAGDGGPATAATLSTTSDVDLDPSGNLYILQNTAPNSKVRIVNRQTGIINTYVGTGASTETGDGGPAVTATINGPFGTSVDRFGHLFTDDYTGNTVRSTSLNTLFSWTPLGTTHAAQKVVVQAANALTLQSAVIVPATSTEFATTAPTGCTVGAAVAAAAYCSFSVSFTPLLPGYRTGRLTLTDGAGVVTNIGLSGYGTSPAVAFSPATLTTIGGTGTAGAPGTATTATAALVNAPRGAALDAAGNFYFADSGNHVVRRITPAGTITTVAGTGTQGFSGDGASALLAQLNQPTYVAVDPAGNLYISDSGNNRIRFVDANTGSISTIAGTSSTAYVADFGDATSASLSNPQGLALNPDGTLFVADTGHNVVRRFFPKTGNMVTVAGTGAAGFSGDGGPALAATLSAPAALAIDAAGNMYIADSGNAVIRVVNLFGQISTFAGKQGTSTNAGDNGQATAASLVAPSDVALDAAGDVYIASGGQVRLVTTAGTISTLAGTGAQGGFSGEGGPALNAVLPSPVANIAVAGNGDVYLSTPTANRVLRVNASSAPALDFGSQAPNSTSSAQVVTVVNIGNAPLAFSAIAASSNFQLQSGATNQCLASSTLSPGQVCTLAIVFNPTVTGPLAGTVTLTDNSLNATGSTQTISLTGVSKNINVTSTTVGVSPSTVSYGTTATVTATVSGAVNATGDVIFSVNGTTVARASISGRTATAAVPGLQVGQAVIAASYLGDGNNGSSTGTLAVTVQPAVLTVAVSDVTSAAHLAPAAFQYTISGFVNGDTTAVVTGAPAISTTATIYSNPGTYPITASQGTLKSGNYTFRFAPGTLTLTAGGPFGYALNAIAPNLKVAAGDSIGLPITATPIGAYTGTLTFSCTGLPATYQCFFSPASLTISGSAVQAVQLTVQTTHAFNRFPFQVPWSRRAVQTISAALMFPGFLALTLYRRRLGSMRRLIMLAGVLGVTTALVGCGQVPADNTGKYTVTVTASDGGLTQNVQTTFDLVIR